MSGLPRVNQYWAQYFPDGSIENRPGMVTFLFVLTWSGRRGWSMLSPLAVAGDFKWAMDMVKAMSILADMVEVRRGRRPYVSMEKTREFLDIMSQFSKVDKEQGLLRLAREW